MTHSIVRVRHVQGDLGWHDSKSGAIYADSDPSLRLMASWRVNSLEDREDFGVPEEGWFTAYGYWLPVEEQA